MPKFTRSRFQRVFSMNTNRRPEAPWGAIEASSVTRNRSGSAARPAPAHTAANRRNRKRMAVSSLTCPARPPGKLAPRGMFCHTQTLPTILFRGCFFLLAAASLAAQPSPAAAEAFHYSVEWRLIHAGTADLVMQRKTDAVEGQLALRSAGLVSRLF